MFSWLIILIVMVGACLPSLLWLLFFLREDEHPEPPRLLIFTFSGGIFISIFTIAVQYLFQNLIGKGEIAFFISIIAFAFIEEFFKFFAAFWSVRKNREFNEPVDGMIYVVTAALGFASIENLFILSNSALAPIGAESFNQTGITLTLRFLGATFLHALSSALVGYYWVKGIMKNSPKNFIALGLVIATLVHSVFNFLIFRFQDKNLLIYPSIFLVAVAFFVLVDFEKLEGEEKQVNK